MRVITKKSVLAFRSRRTMRSGNMSVSTCEGVTALRLHGNSIARMDANGVVSISNAGWNSRTTNDRLNGLLYYLPGRGRVYCKDFSAYFNGAPWNGQWTVVYNPEVERQAARTLDAIASQVRARLDTLARIDSNFVDSTRAVENS